LNTDQDLKKTVLFDRHRALNARMVPFAGFLMPIQYRGIIQEHINVRTKAGLFDVSHMGELVLEGPEAKPFLQYMTINDLNHLEPGQAQYSAFCNEQGGIIDDLLIYQFPDHYMIVVNAANIEKDYQWLRSHLPEGVALRNESDGISLIALQGPASRDILNPLIDADLKQLPYYHFVEVEIAGRQVVCARTGYTGELGYEIYGGNEEIRGLWDVLMETGKSRGLTPVGLGARDTLRLEMKYCLYGNDIDETTTPIEAGLGWITKIEKGDFIGRQAILDNKVNVTRRLVCVEMMEKGIPRPGYKLYVNGREVGTVTSGGQSPSLRKGIALAYLKKPYYKAGTILELDIRGKRKRGRVVKPPFYKNGTIHI